MKTSTSPEEYDLLVLGSGAAGKLLSWTLAKKGIRVNTVSPGTIQTEMIGRMLGDGESDAKKWWANQHPVGRFGSPEEVAAAVVWLASPEASFVTGTDIAVDGGYLAQ